MVTSMIARAPTIATATASRPERIAGTMNFATMTRLIASPIGERSPRHRPSISTIAAKMSTSQKMGALRSKPANAKGGVAAGSAPGGTAFL